MPSTEHSYFQNDKHVNFDGPMLADWSFFDSIRERIETGDFIETVKQLSEPATFWEMFHQNGQNIFRWWWISSFKKQFAALDVTKKAAVLCAMLEILDEINDCFSSKVLVRFAEEIVGLMKPSLNDVALAHVETFMESCASRDNCSTNAVQRLVCIVFGYLAHQQTAVVAA